MDEKRIAPSASQLLRGVLQRSWLQICIQLTVVKEPDLSGSRANGALERNKTLGRLRIKGFLTFPTASKCFYHSRRSSVSWSKLSKTDSPLQCYRMCANVFKATAFGKSHRKLTDGRSRLAYHKFQRFTVSAKHRSTSKRAQSNARLRLSFQ